MSSVGIVETKYFEFGELSLESGEKLSPVKLAYETYGQLNADKSNAILIFHALSGDAHVAGKKSPNDKKSGWWDNMVGPGKAFDTNKYFVLCINNIGGCAGSTGPSSINPETKQPFGSNFPQITINDIVKAQVRLLDELGIGAVFAATGGSMGGMLVLQFAVSYPDRVKNVIPIATTARLSAQGIAFNEVGRRAILNDSKNPPNDGLAIARMIGHITYLSDESMTKKFGRKVKGSQFEVESYLQHQGASFTERFDAQTYLYITKTMDNFNLADEGAGSLREALAKAKANFFVIYFKSDWLFPEYQSLEIVDALKDEFRHVSYRKIASSYGHDAFLLETEELTEAIMSFLAGVSE
ncbi:MAG: homoserine O-acetyltransferase [bacterium]